MPAGKLSTLERLAFALALLAECATLALCLVTRPSPASLLAPVLGPWAGYAYGHAECTLGRVLPLASFGALLALLLAGVALFATRGSHRRPFAVVYLALALIVWCGMTVLSVVNSLE